MAVNRSSARRKTTLRVEVARVYQDAILDAAKRVFGEHGFEKAKMVDIAKRAGLAAGTLYNYFESKEQIFQSLMQQQMDSAHARFAAVAEESHPPRESLRALVRAVLEHMEEHRDMVEILLQMGIRKTWAMTEMCGPKVMERRKEMRKLFETEVARATKAGLLRKDVARGDLVAILAGSMNGVIEAWMTEGAKRRLADRADVVVDVFFNGAAKR
jgi:AcrR family transcriptional regulator